MLYRLKNKHARLVLPGYGRVRPDAIVDMDPVKAAPYLSVLEPLPDVDSEAELLEAFASVAGTAVSEAKHLDVDMDGDGVADATIHEPVVTPPVSELEPEKSKHKPKKSKSKATAEAEASVGATPVGADVSATPLHQESAPAEITENVDAKIPSEDSNG